MLEESKPVRQAFGSPGGKSYLAPKIVGMIPPHETYVEPFAGGAAVYFKKPPSEKEVLSDKDREIAFAFRFLRDMTPEQFERLKRYDWRVSRELFGKVKTSEPKDDMGRFRKFYYLRKASLANASKTVSPLRDGNTIDVAHLWKAHERLKRTAIHGGDAIAMIRKYDSPVAFHYLDPPYPDRAFVGATEKYTTEDLARLVEVLKGVKGKFALSLGTGHISLLPKDWHIKRVKVRRRIPKGEGGFNQTFGYEIIATNYNPDTVARHKADYGVARPQLATRRRMPRRKANARRFYTPTVVSLARSRG